MPMGTLAPMGGQSPDIILLSTQSIVAYSRGRCSIQLIKNNPNQPSNNTTVANTVSGLITYAPGLNVTVRVTGGPQYFTTFDYGIGPGVLDYNYRYQGTPGTLNATGALTTALLLTGIVTSSTAAPVTATLDTGTVTDTSVMIAAAGLPDSALVNDGWIWSVINTGGANAFTVTAATGHTLVGSGVVALGTSGRFLTRRTAANTYVTYRLS